MNLLRGTTLIVLSSMITLSACHLNERKNDASSTPPKDPRYLKKFDHKGAWFCRLVVPYTKKVDDKETRQEPLRFVEVAESGEEMKTKLADDCREADSSARDACQKALDSDTGDNANYLCVQASQFLPRFIDFAEAKGNWVCEMPYSYSVEVMNPPAKTDAKTTQKTTQSKTSEAAKAVTLMLMAPMPAASASPSPSPSVSPSPSPTSHMETRDETIQSEATTSYDAIESAFEKCKDVSDEISRIACTEKMIALGMKCRNKDVAPGAFPKRKTIRTRH